MGKAAKPYDIYYKIEIERERERKRAGEENVEEGDEETGEKGISCV